MKKLKKRSVKLAGAHIFLERCLQANILLLVNTISPTKNSISTYVVETALIRR
ncbi:MAG: hypothetical protein J6A11_02295 [Lachnospiraceae bacterium]|nr:hypothetical protein [Lachnospiraceae bacterium]